MAGKGHGRWGAGLCRTGLNQTLTNSLQCLNEFNWGPKVEYERSFAPPMVMVCLVLGKETVLVKSEAVQQAPVACIPGLGKAEILASLVLLSGSGFCWIRSGLLGSLNREILALRCWVRRQAAVGRNPCH